MNEKYETIYREPRKVEGELRERLIRDIEEDLPMDFEISMKWATARKTRT